ncbi:MAG: beta-N-acetylhexosaminidase [Nitrospirae bacterium]|nr:beta-N-acetylhexosaminidase [Nitrospirota bacterium]
MEIRDLIGQFLFVGFEGKKPSKELIEMIKKYKIGGVILFKRNIESLPQLVKLTSDLQKLSAPRSLFIGIDQEGGRVSRLSREFTLFPAMEFLGKLDDISLTYRVGEVTAKELKGVGINVNFAPVLDIHSQKKNPIIGDRAFGETPALVSKHGLALIMGHEDNGVMPCGKHFPGHGDTTTDSHKTLPRIDHSLERLLDFEMKPFQHAVANRLEAVMTAHVLYTQLDPDHPASLSKNIISNILRNGMRFDGLVISDDLEMMAIRDHYSVKEAAVRAISAGSDTLLVCKEAALQIEAYEGILNAFEKNILTQERLTESLDRIFRLKEKYAGLIPPVPKLKQALAIVGSESHRAVLSKVLEFSKRKSPSPVKSSRHTVNS